MDSCRTLHHAAHEGDIELLDGLLTQGADIHVTDGWRRTPLHAAAGAGHQESVRVLIDHGADVNRRTLFGRTPLHEAVYNGHVKVVTLLLTHGADPNTKDNAGHSSVKLAALRGHATIVQLFQGSKVDIEHSELASTLLHGAARSCNTAGVTMSLEMGANVNAGDKYGTTALHEAAANGHAVVVEQLSHNGADVNIVDGKGLTSLQIAVELEHQDVVEKLLLSGAKTDVADSKGMSPLHIAVLMGNPTLAKLLLTYQANPDIEDQEGMTPLHYAIKHASAEIMRILVAHGARVDATNNKGRTVLSFAAELGHSHLAKELLAWGGDTKIADRGGDTPLHVAAWCDHVHVAVVLLAHDADVNAANQTGLTPLHIAVMHGDMRMIAALLAAGANIHAHDVKGRSPVDFVTDRLQYEQEEEDERRRLKEMAYQEAERQGVSMFWLPPSRQIVTLTAEKLEEIGRLLMTAPAEAIRQVRATPRGVFGSRERLKHDEVDCTVFGPPVIQPGEVLLIQVFVHLATQEKKAETAAKEFDEDAQRRGVNSLGTCISQGSKFTFELDIPPLQPEEHTRELVWQQKTEVVQFVVTVPGKLPPQKIIGKIFISQDTVPIGQVSFTIKVINEAIVAEEAINVTGKAHRYQSVFLSYAPEDRSQVLLRAPMLTAVGISFPEGILYAEPNDEWLPKVYEWIESSDAFLLFWSNNARKSKWVKKQWQYALKRKEKNCIHPVIIEDTSVPVPPPELAHLHFVGKMQYFAPRTILGGDHINQEEGLSNLRVIHQLLIESFTEEELRRFCRDRPAFQPLVPRFSKSAGLETLVDNVIEWCQKRDLFADLLTAVHEENPRQYERFSEKLGGEGRQAGSASIAPVSNIHTPESRAQ